MHACAMTHFHVSYIVWQPRILRSARASMLTTRQVDMFKSQINKIIYTKLLKRVLLSISLLVVECAVAVNYDSLQHTATL